MKVLFDATAMALTGYHKGGAYRYGLEILRNMPGLAEASDSFRLYFNFSRGAHKPKMRETCELAGNMAHRLCRFPPEWLLKLGIPADWTGGAHDVFHGPFDLLPHTKKSARVVTIHDLAFRRAPEGLPLDWIAQREATVPASARRAHHIITVSEFSKRDIVEEFQIPPERVQAIYHGISDGLQQPDDPEADAQRLLERYKIKPGFILYLGTLQPNKNIEGLCRAYQILRRKGFEGQLVLAGAKGWLFDEMWGRITANHDDENVLLTGFVDDEDVPRLYGNCASFALVSFLEGFGIPVIEAMACGAPVVAADACSLTEVAGPAGLLVDPNDTDSIANALERASLPSSERGELVRAGLEWASTFTWEKTAKQHLDAYRHSIETAS